MATVAVEVNRVSKAFRIPHETRDTVKEHFLHPLKRTTFELNEAVNDISFSIDRGEFFGIIGPNGSGKSTLLKIICGIYPADSGVVRVHGLLSPFLELGVGFNPELTARDNVRINGTLLGLTRKQLDERFDAVIEFAELERFVDQKLKNFSSGMQLRLAYSIAIQVDFDILVLDEVLAVGDQSFQEKCFATFTRLREEKKTIIFVSHDLGSVRTFCDRTLLVRNGIAEALGPPDEVIEAYLGSEHASVLAAAHES
jgi:ABC-type polysaccharide/polyol phosphate transport system ATPase subunit